MSLQREFDAPLQGCALCHHPLKEGDPVYEEQSGWAKRRPRGGTGALVLRKATGRLACLRCIERARLGVHRDQLTFS